MSDAARLGSQVLRRTVPAEAWHDFKVEIVRTLDDYQRIVALRAVAFMAEQNCPFEEEFDGNDFAATHMLAFAGGEAVAALRLRWFASFGKVERVCVAPGHRGSPALTVLLAHAFEHAARKGYKLMIAQIQARLWPLWSRLLRCRLRANRPPFTFSDYDYLEIDIPLPVHPKAIGPDADPYLVIRPEGEWDREGVLDASAKRTRDRDQAA